MIPIIKKAKAWFGQRKVKIAYNGFQKRSRWDAASTDRLNKGHWSKAGGAADPITNSMVGSLSAIQQRCVYEISNNPMVDGVVETWATDLVGTGPNMQCQSSNDAFNIDIEKVWREWWAAPDVTGRLSGAAMLRMCARLLWSYGEFTAQIVTDAKAKGRIKTRVYSIHPRRLSTPVSMIMKGNVLLGIEADKFGRPINYYFQREKNVYGGVMQEVEWDTIPSAGIIHHFKSSEPDQVRGFPLLASALNSIAELRDYDSQVMDAARAAADKEFFLFARGSDVETFALDDPETLEVERRTIKTLPPGWEPFESNPGQPAANYVEYRHERLREIGRPVNMPLMTVLLDSSNHNYASARFDGQNYQRGLITERTSINHSTLDRLSGSVAREAELSLGMIRPDDARFVWTWPPMPHVDPSKEAKADNQRLKDFVTSRTRVCAALGVDFETLVNELSREKALLDGAGLTAPEIDAAIAKEGAKDGSKN